MKRIALVVCFLALILISPKALGQGCSDAGFCSAGNLKASTRGDSAKVSTVSLKLAFGSGEEGVSIMHIIPEMNWQLSESSGMQFSIPFVFTSGDLGSTSGTGDLLLAYTYRFLQKNKLSMSGTIGTKLATGKTDLKDGGFYSLPMPYQSGLGSYDLILGWSMMYNNRVSVAAGLQKVLSHDNDNTFLHYPSVTIDELKYFQSQNLKRGDDILVRAGFKSRLGEVSVTPGILAIYRIAKDKITDQFGIERELEGSDGLTFNVTVSVALPLGEKFSLSAEAGAPAVVRDVRADGLTRSFVAAASLRYHFN
jgi:hypothetical protein